LPVHRVRTREEFPGICSLAVYLPTVGLPNLVPAQAGSANRDIERTDLMFEITWAGPGLLGRGGAPGVSNVWCTLRT
jgi:hypothetical protein